MLGIGESCRVCEPQHGITHTIWLSLDYQFCRYRMVHQTL
jgi:hypothetical protein